MWIEVIGLPGVGKTTIIERHLPLIRETHAVVQSRTAGILQRLYTKYLYFTFYRRRTRNIKLAKKLAYRAGFRLFKRQADNVFFYDSGTLQVIIEHLIESDFSDSDMTLPMIRDCIAAQTVIFFQDDIAEIIHREYNRQPRRFDFSKEELESRYIRAQKVIEESVLPHVPNVYSIKISNFSEEQWKMIING